MSVLLSIFFFIFLILILLEHPEILFSKKKMVHFYFLVCHSRSGLLNFFFHE